ncbi:hypothetical protein C7B69_02905 [filamentous cyanobacterium Phorm 46]|nr:hypothetical protein C7B69_02905 [filamentous cyanobacterium Phorm 46]
MGVVHINCHFNEGRRKKEEGRRKKEEGRGKREEGRGKKVLQSRWLSKVALDWCQVNVKRSIDSLFYY